jgi:threonine dehydrogenase-like Zn-dependent dehydrogenase
MAKIVVDEIRVIGSRCGDIRTALNFIEKDIIDFPQLVEAEYSFGEFSKAFEHAKHSQSKKIILCYN